MNARLLSEVHLLRERVPQAELDLATEGVLRYVWQGRFGTMLIEVIEDRVYVDGQLVERCAAAPESSGRGSVGGPAAAPSL
jgi:hypothetical protein